jgi:predicted ATPase
MIDKITEQLGEYFKNSKQEFWIGIQNFQGVREYTQIPLAPLTLVYGQNSAGKSTLHDAQQFIHGYFSGQWDSATTKGYLNRWANHNRVTEPLAKGYIGKPEDVVISVSSVTGCDDYFEYQEQTYYHNKFSNKYSVTGLAEILFNTHQEIPIPFRMDVHFSNSLDDWIIRQISLYLGEEILAEFIFDDFAKYDMLDDYALLRINKNHLVYSLLNGHFEGGIASLSKHPYHQDDAGDNWFLFFDMDITGSLELKNVIGWYGVDDCFWDSNPSSEILEFRTFILSLLQIPAIGIAKNFNFASVPPLRPIPSKQNAVFRFHLNEHDDKSGWGAIAEQICFKTMHGKISGRKEASFSSLYKINNFLLHESFLNTGYEITGECLFLVPIDLIMDTNHSKEEIFELIRNNEVEVHLKLINKANGQLIEIEDVGVGISQIIPVLTAILICNDSRTNSYKAFIQQPELHLHPKLQAQLADVFIETINSHLQAGFFPTFIIESHSEHFLLRLLRRIRETHKSKNKDQLRGLSSKDLSVLYVDKLEDGSSKIFPLRLSPEGEFIDRWPYGFFTERDGELFDE